MFNSLKSQKMKKLLLIIIAFMFFAVSCEKDPIQNVQQSSGITNNTGKPATGVIGTDQNLNGMHTMSIYCNGQLYTALVKELSATETDGMIGQSRSVKTFFIATTLLPDNGLDFWFNPVLDNINNNNPYTLYFEIKINYDSRVGRPYPFTSSSDILYAASQFNSGISVVPTGKTVMVKILTMPNPFEP